ncbi:hypothetical protein GCK72_002734 [Caenorhabditis remanei]|uniref:Uncharacterized protein n=1 Tax=Caenorhabditis remanei TaxID=31234 RepID=A0A6A5HRT6_CAERE|nr:hypothetical protein GCK72_002734 [Caenorhabditis remanei]KAF1770910.1 hypothetical protein GCK72_002734 [Caenorhabditis remanei]
MRYESEDDDDEEGLIHEESLENLMKRRASDPLFLDFNTWKKKVGSLIQSENHVLMHSDETLRNAINEAMFLEVASDNLMKKRKMQFELLDECRKEEGSKAKKLYEENMDTLKKDYGWKFNSYSKMLTSAFERATLPFDAPDITRPPPFQLPKMNVPPPTFFNSTLVRPASASSSTSSVTMALARAAITPSPRVSVPLISSHLLPPPVEKNVIRDFSREDLDEKKKKEKKVEAVKPNVQETKPTAKLPVIRAFQSTSWRIPYHPVPVPPPKAYFAGIPPTPPPSLQRNTAVARRSRFTGGNERSTPSPSSDSSQSSGVVGINVRGLFVGNRQRQSSGSSPAN